MEWWSVLAFNYESVIERWEDARFAHDLERAWLAAGRPDAARAYIAASSDEFAFRFYLNQAAAKLVNGLWSGRLTRNATGLPPNARPILPPI